MKKTTEQVPELSSEQRTVHFTCVCCERPLSYTLDPITVQSFAGQHLRVMVNCCCGLTNVVTVKVGK